jgi:imidazole glycerol-phosphate synthase subunit HisH
MKIGIIDVGFGNIKAIVNQCEYLSFSTKAITMPEDISSDVTHLILPGVGSFDYGMSQLRKVGMDAEIQKFCIQSQQPFLGICLGMHLLGNKSEEGSSLGLSLIDATVKKITIPDGSNLRLPHIGWRNLRIEQKSRLLPDTNQKMRTYFTHSFHFVPANIELITSTVSYGNFLCSSIESDNIFGVQFHPEKSHNFGAEIIKEFGQI